MRIRGERPELWAAEAPIGCARGAEDRSRNTATSRSSAAWERRHPGLGWRYAARRGRGRAEWPWGPVTSLGLLQAGIGEVPGELGSATWRVQGGGAARRSVAEPDELRIPTGEEDGSLHRIYSS